MPIIFVYPEGRDYTRQVEEYVRDYDRLVGRDSETVDPDSREGADFCRTYDIIEYPTVIAIAEDGSALKTWKGIDLPLMNEVAYYDNPN